MPRSSQKSRLLETIAFQTVARYVLAEDCDEEDLVLEEGLEELTAVTVHRYGVDFIHESVVKSRVWCTDVLPNLDEDRFRQMVRVSWLQFEMIAELIKSDHLFKPKLQFPVEVQLMIVLYRLGSSGEGASVAKIANLFGIGDGGTLEIVTRRVFQAILRIKDRFIRWPDVEERAAIVSNTYDELPYCVAFIDGTEIPLAEKPSANPDDYYSRKQRFSIKAQTVCDHNLVVRSVTVGYPGSVHDARIFSLSKLGRNPQNFLSNNQWIAGDSAYKLTTTMLTPFKRPSRGTLSDAQKAFNKRFCRYRVRVEHCFGEIKERFNSLKELKIRIKDERSAKLCCDWFVVCVVLHNIVKISKIDDEPFETDSNQLADQDDDENADFHDVQAPDTEGVQKRNALMALIGNL